MPLGTASNHCRYHLVALCLLFSLAGCGRSTDQRNRAASRSATGIDPMAAAVEDVPEPPAEQGGFRRRGVIHHAAGFSGALFSYDGKTLVTGNGDSTAKLWRADSGRQIGPTLQHPAAVLYMALAPDGKTAVTASATLEGQLWDLASGKQLGSMFRHTDGYYGGVTCVGYARNGRVAVTGGNDAAVHVWDAATGNAVGEPIRFQSLVIRLAGSPDGKTLLVALNDNTAHLWDLAAGKQVGEPLQHDARIGRMTFRGDGKQVVTGSADGKVRIWDPTTSKLLTTLRLPESPADIAYSKDGKRLQAASIGSSRVWDVASGNQIGTSCSFPKGVSGVAIGPDADRVFTGHFDGRSATLWDAISGQPIGTVSIGKPVALVAYSPDGKTVFTGAEQGDGWIWEIAAQKQ